MGTTLPGGLRVRLAVAIVLIVALTLGVAFFAVFKGTESELRSSVEEDLSLRADQVERQLLAGGPEEGDEVRREARRVAASQPVGAESVVVAISRGRDLLATSQPEILAPPGKGTPRMGEEGRWDEDSEEDEREEEREEFEETREFLASPAGYSEQKLEDLGQTLVLTRSVAGVAGPELTIRVGKSLKPTEDALEDLSGTFLRLGLVALLISAVLAWFLAARITKPLRRLTALSGEVAGDGLSVRMPLEEAGSDEVRTLSVAFNGMLDRLEDAFERQRAFVADASHDLRTPLTIVRGQIEVLARNPDPNPEEVAAVSRAVGEAVGRMEGLVDDLLLLARSDSEESAATERLTVGPILEAEREGRVEAEQGRIEIGEVTEREVEFDPVALSRAVSNLVDNALRHGGPESRVRIGARASGKGVEIEVDDDGPGVPPAERERVFDRFARLDEARSSQTGGSGLGLAIVRAMVEAGGGRVSCSASEMGGARFSIWLPDSPQPVG